MTAASDDGRRGHLPGEATPHDAPALDTPTPVFGLNDRNWSQDDWYRLLAALVDRDVVDWKEIAALVLGHLNPSQVGTSLASSEGFKRRYGKGNTMKVVMDWVYKQNGRCADCNARLELQADHVQGREQFEDPLDADFIENMTLRCRRCNVVRRPSHEFGGLTYLTAESALMWILFVLRSRTFADYVRMCRLYGMTMSDIRMGEAWAMAHWLSRSDPPAYGVEDDAESFYDLLLWSDGAVTRTDVGGDVPVGARQLYAAIPGSARLGFVTLQDSRYKFHEQDISFIPFSTYDLGERPPQALCIHYAPPDRENNLPQRLRNLPPRGAELITHSIRTEEQCFRLLPKGSAGLNSQDLAPAPFYGRLLKFRSPPERLSLVATDAQPPFL